MQVLTLNAVYTSEPFRTQGSFPKLVSTYRPAKLSGSMHTALLVNRNSLARRSHACYNRPRSTVYNKISVPRRLLPRPTGHADYIFAARHSCVSNLQAQPPPGISAYESPVSKSRWNASVRIPQSDGPARRARMQLKRLDGPVGEPALSVLGVQWWADEASSEALGDPQAHQVVDRLGGFKIRIRI